MTRPKVPFVLPRPPRRPKPVVVIFTILGSLFGLGAVFGLAVAIATGDPTESIVELPEEPAPPGSASVSLTATSVNATAGLLQARVTIAPAADMMDSGNLAQDLKVAINDASGNSSLTFRAGDPPPPIEATLLLRDGAIAQYPFDSYSSLLFLRLTVPEGSKEDRVVPISIGVQSNLSGFEMTAEPGEGKSFVDDDIALASFKITRSWASFVYALGTMAIMLGLAITGLRIIWATYAWRIESPPWLYGFLIGALFALPPLRSSLPGAPPAGAIVDYLSFYPAVAVIAVAMLVTMSHWLGEARPLPPAPVEAEESENQQDETTS